MRNRRLVPRVSEIEKAMIEARAVKSGLPVSEYIRRCCLGKKIVTVNGLPELAAQTKRIGANLNQLSALLYLVIISSKAINAQHIKHIAAPDFLDHLAVLGPFKIFSGLMIGINVPAFYIVLFQCDSLPVSILIGAGNAYIPIYLHNIAVPLLYKIVFCSF